jgi:hypothetical protein
MHKDGETERDKQRYRERQGEIDKETDRNRDRDVHAGCVVCNRSRQRQSN